MLISIITVNYNNLSGLIRTGESVLNQSWQEFEFIVIDGGSTDGSKEYLESQDEKIKYWVSEPDNGIYSAMNKGIWEASGDYLFFLNSGDHFNDEDSLNAIQKHLKQFEVIYFNINIVNNGVSQILENPKTMSFEYLYNNLPCHQCTFIQKKAFDRIGSYDEGLKIVADWKWLILALLKHNASYLHVNDVFSTFYNDGVSSLEENQHLIQSEREKVLNSEFPIFMNDLKTIYKLKRVIRNLRKSKKINLLIRLGLLDKF
ncbi:glycosyltransferase family 2 protein [Mariniflexile sp. AS56]|uniref:glycosyltransferase family 2 protein n=1 Tax=Mariniflexile sp. AS56 TaxID=3063957 RepID=UPI0026EB9EDB|nr:glycosyltransferase family 2 protein [Mariniflexile sp. AS56]MDO7172732.1 glycosyltransferase family 2 protein [Mariniflexile sp. AS56]